MSVERSIIRAGLVVAVAAALTVWVVVRPARAGAPIPPERRIPAGVARTLSAPADAPMHMPTDVAVDAAGRVFVADGANDRVVVFRADGALDRAISRVGEWPLNHPVGLAIDSAGRLWIADTGHHRVLIAAPDGALAERIDLPAAEGGKPFDVTDVAVTADRKRAYLIDNENHRLAIRDNAAGTLTFLGAFGEGLGQFRWPFTAAIAPDGYVYVCEAIGARVQRLSPADRWAGQVGRWGVELGLLYRPKGVLVDGQGRLYVSDSTLNVIQVFNARGGVEGVLTDPAGKPLRFAHPMGMDFDAAGGLYVVELKADRVAVVTLPSGFAPATRPASAGTREEPAR
ncbi:MAG: hypothetical protein HRF43_08095 [Phycisphaerae bacterium]